VVLLANNVVFAWGANDSGQVSPMPGSGTTIDASFRVDGLPAIVEIAAGQNHSFAIDRNGTVWAWGGNASGQLGLGNATSPIVPTAIPGLNLN
jgi:alpha-tubulin suppressor-like RCC1 family protein